MSGGDIDRGRAGGAPARTPSLKAKFRVLFAVVIVSFAAFGWFVVDRIRVVNEQAVAIYLEALRLLRDRGADMSPKERRLVIDGLAKVTRKRVGDPNALQGTGPACAVG